MGTERRKAGRFKAEVYLSFRTKSIFSRRESPIIIVKDISAAGVSFVYPESLPLGQKLILTLYLPMYTKPVKVEAEVKNSERLPDGQYKTGLEFTQISPAIKENLEPRTFLSYRLKISED